MLWSSNEYWVSWLEILTMSMWPSITDDIVMHIATPSKTDLTLGWILRSDKTTGYYKRISTLTIEPQISTCKKVWNYQINKKIPLHPRPIGIHPKTGMVNVLQMTFK